MCCSMSETDHDGGAGSELRGAPLLGGRITCCIAMLCCDPFSPWLLVKPLGQAVQQRYLISSEQQSPGKNWFCLALCFPGAAFVGVGCSHSKVSGNWYSKSS